MQIKPMCRAHDCALLSEPEETDCLAPRSDGWFEMDLSAWWCPKNTEEDVPGKMWEPGACGDSWYFLVRNSEDTQKEGTYE
jgi:hypothetical protein